MLCVYVCMHVSVAQNTPNIPRFTFHLIRQCPHLVNNKNTEVPDKRGNESRDSNYVSNIALAEKSSRSNYNEDGEPTEE